MPEWRFTPKLNTEARCPRCGGGASGGGTFNDERIVPEAGDISICAYCQSVNVYNADLTVRAMTDEELAALSPEEREEFAEAKRLMRLMNSPSRGRA